MIWITRDYINGELLNCDVWENKPTAIVSRCEWLDGEDVIWAVQPPHKGEVLEDLSPEECKAKYKTIPETWRECIRYG